MKYIYIDTNIYLDMYEFNSEVYKSLGTILDLLNNNLIKLYIPVQTKNEFWRNRCVRLKSTMNRFKQSISKPQIPAFSNTYDYITKIRTHTSAISDNVNKACDVIMSHVNNKTLKEDELVNKIFSHGNTIPIDMSDELYVLGDRRVKCGHPPGKPNSHGDAYNWVCVLDKHKNYDLHIVTGDHDYYEYSKNYDNIHPYINQEFMDDNPNNILHIYNTVKSFLDKAYPRYIDTSDVALNAYIDELYKAGCYKEAKSKIINMLSNIESISISNKFIIGVTNAYITNNQIHRISTDKEVQDLIKFIDNRISEIPSDIKEKYNEIKNKFINTN